MNKINDLISRQAAIDALMVAVDDVGVLDAEDIETAFALLPSAQPEIIRCKDCRNNHWCNIQEAAMAGDNFFCGAAERRIDG